MQSASLENNRLRSRFKWSTDQRLADQRHAVEAEECASRDVLHDSLLEQHRSRIGNWIVEHQYHYFHSDEVLRLFLRQQQHNNNNISSRSPSQGEQKATDTEMDAMDEPWKDEEEVLRLLRGGGRHLGSGVAVVATALTPGSRSMLSMQQKPYRDSPFGGGTTPRTGNITHPTPLSRSSPTGEPPAAASGHRYLISVPFTDKDHLGNNNNKDQQENNKASRTAAEMGQEVPPQSTRVPEEGRIKGTTASSVLLTPVEWDAVSSTDDVVAVPFSGSRSTDRTPRAANDDDRDEGYSILSEPSEGLLSNHDRPRSVPTTFTPEAVVSLSSSERSTPFRQPRFEGASSPQPHEEDSPTTSPSPHLDSLPVRGEAAVALSSDRHRGSSLSFSSTSLSGTRRNHESSTSSSTVASQAIVALLCDEEAHQRANIAQWSASDHHGLLLSRIVQEEQLTRRACEMLWLPQLNETVEWRYRYVTLHQRHKMVTEQIVKTEVSQRTFLSACRRMDAAGLTHRASLQSHILGERLSLFASVLFQLFYEQAVMLANDEDEQFGSMCDEFSYGPKPKPSQEMLPEFSPQRSDDGDDDDEQALHPHRAPPTPEPSPMWAAPLSLTSPTAFVQQLSRPSFRRESGSRSPPSEPSRTRSTMYSLASPPRQEREDSQATNHSSSSSFMQQQQHDGLEYGNPLRSRNRGMDNQNDFATIVHRVEDGEEEAEEEPTAVRSVPNADVQGGPSPNVRAPTPEPQRPLWLLSPTATAASARAASPWIGRGEDHDDEEEDVPHPSAEQPMPTPEFRHAPPPNHNSPIPPLAVQLPEVLTRTWKQQSKELNQDEKAQRDSIANCSNQLSLLMEEDILLCNETCSRVTIQQTALKHVARLQRQFADATATVMAQEETVRRRVLIEVAQSTRESLQQQSLCDEAEILRGAWIKQEIVERDALQSWD
jgi:hypothetical protein